MTNHILQLAGFSIAAHILKLKIDKTDSVEILSLLSLEAN